MKNLTRLMTIALVLFSLVLVGCGEKKEDSKKDAKKTEVAKKATPETEIENAAKAFFNAMKDGNLDTMSGLLSVKAKADFEKSFSTGNAEQDKAAKEFMVGMMQSMLKDAKIEYGKVEIDGDNATIEVTGSMGGKKEETDKMEFVKEDGKWLVAEM